jgi:hypothetical protein
LELFEEYTIWWIESFGLATTCAAMGATNIACLREVMGDHHGARVAHMISAAGREMMYGLSQEGTIVGLRTSAECAEYLVAQ